MNELSLPVPEDMDKAWDIFKRSAEYEGVLRLAAKHGRRTLEGLQSVDIGFAADVAYASFFRGWYDRTQQETKDE